MANRLGVMTPSSAPMSSSAQAAKGSSTAAAKPAHDANVIKRYAIITTCTHTAPSLMQHAASNPN